MRRFVFGEWIEVQSLDVPAVESLCDLAEKQRQIFAQYPYDKTLSVLEKLGAKWNDRNYPRRQRLLKTLPKATGFSEQMVELGLNELVSVCSRTALKKKLKTELRGLSPIEWSYCEQTHTATQWQPLGVMLHVLSGNVFLVGIGSLIEGLITGNVNILKMSSAETLFLPELIDSIAEVDEDGVVLRSIAVIEYSSNQKDVIAAFKKRVDGIVVWGGEEAVRAYRNDLPARTKVIVFGPKLSLSVVTQSGIKEKNIDSIAEKMAFEVSVWDQNACTAPQVCFVQGRKEAVELGNAMASALTRISTELPAGPADTHTAAEIQKLRGRFDISESREQGKVWRSPSGVDWTILLDLDKTIEPSCLHRTIRLIPFSEIGDVEEELGKLRGYIQTVGLCASDVERSSIARYILGAGALRVVELGTQSGGEIDEPHDGSFDLPQFGHVVFHRGGNKLHPMDVLSPAEQQKVIDHRLRELIQTAKKSEFYAKRLGQVRIDSTKDLAKVPILTREQMDANMPPHSFGLRTLDYAGGYVTRSGGSTGAPKFSVYDDHDWDQMISHAVRVLNAAGLERGDRVANCMLAGDLYGSFVSFDHINYRVGATTYAFAGQLEPENFLDIWRKFGINAIESMPSVLMPLLRVAKQMAHDFKLDKIIYAGIPLSGSDRTWIENNIHPKSICSVVGANDGGQIAYQCSHLKGQQHHTMDEFNYIEIVDADGSPVREGEAGRILITSLKKFAFPLIRYDIGDAGRFLGHFCECGRAGRLIDYLGRSDDTVCIGLLNLRYRDVLEAMSGFNFSLVQLVARSRELGESVELRIETEEVDPGFKERVKEAILKKLPPIQEVIQSGHLQDFSIELYTPGSLPRNPRTGKVKLLCDERF